MLINTYRNNRRDNKYRQSEHTMQTVINKASSIIKIEHIKLQKHSLSHININRPY